MRRVLVVDDDPLIIEILRTILDLEEYDVTAASDGESALEVVGDNDLDVVVLDVMMPGIDGFEVCRRIKDGPDAPPVILLTARDNEDDHAAGKEAGCDGYLTKPFSPLALLDMIDGVSTRAGA